PGVTEAGATLPAESGPPPPAGIDPAVAHLSTGMLSDSEAREPACGRGGPLELPFPCAVKTGTSKDYRDNWPVGYTPRHTVAVWVGNFDGSPMQRSEERRVGKECRVRCAPTGGSHSNDHG